MHWETLEAEPAGDADLDIESEGSDAEGDVWQIGENTASFLVADSKQHDHEPSSPEGQTSPVEKAIAADKFQHVPAFLYLQELNLTELPNVGGTGIGIHFTTNTWQVRYPAGSQKSTARTFGHLTKGWKSSSTALLECLAWAWKQHSGLNPGCSTSKARFQALESALNNGLGKDLA